VKIDTQSSEDSDTFPSTPGQLELLRLLKQELIELELDQVTMDEHGYVFATVPATSGKKNISTIGFLAHVDTSPEMSGKNVKAIVHENYQGQDLVLPDDPSAVIAFADNPHLADQIGCDTWPKSWARWNIC
jgi:tripeptide aminopeptidase